MCAVRYHSDDFLQFCFQNMDMYTRVKRVRRKVKRGIYGQPLLDQKDDKESDDDSSDGGKFSCSFPKKYF